MSSLFFINFLLKWFSLWPLETLSLDACIFLSLLIYCHQSVRFFFPKASLISGNSLISCPIPGIGHFSKEPWFFLLENKQKNQDLGMEWVVLFCWLLPNEIMLTANSAAENPTLQRLQETNRLHCQ